MGRIIRFEFQNLNSNEVYNDSSKPLSLFQQSFSEIQTAEVQGEKSNCPFSGSGKIAGPTCDVTPSPKSRSELLSPAKDTSPGPQSSMKGNFVNLPSSSQSPEIVSKKRSPNTEGSKIIVRTKTTLKVPGEGGNLDYLYSAGTSNAITHNNDINSAGNSPSSATSVRPQNPIGGASKVRMEWFEQDHEDSDYYLSNSHSMEVSLEEMLEESMKEGEKEGQGGEQERKRETERELMQQ